MNNPSSECCKPDNTSQTQKDCSPMVHFGQRQIHHWAVYMGFCAVTAVLVILFSNLDNTYQAGIPFEISPIQAKKKTAFVQIQPKATDKLIEKLKFYGLWKIDPSGKVPRFFINNYPDDLNTLEDISLKKRVFLHSLLPHALFVREEALGKRQRLESILSKIDCPVEDIRFDAGLEFKNQCSWTDSLAEDEVNFIQNLSKVYRTDSAAGLLERVDAVPTSIILAQGALESSWGSSRFTREGNSIFGMWTWKTKGIIPLRRDKGKNHKVKVYDSVLDSVRAYHLTLNRLDTYEEFRQIRQHTDNPLIMAEGLVPYSERGEEYVQEIKKVIIANGLQKYDRFSLSDLGLQKISNTVTQLDMPAKSGKASL
jgi:Bax protein